MNVKSWSFPIPPTIDTASHWIQDISIISPTYVSPSGVDDYKPRFITSLPNLSAYWSNRNGSGNTNPSWNDHLILPNAICKSGSPCIFVISPVCHVFKRVSTSLSRMLALLPTFVQKRVEIWKPEVQLKVGTIIIYAHNRHSQSVAEVHILTEPLSQTWLPSKYLEAMSALEPSGKLRQVSTITRMTRGTAPLAVNTRAHGTNDASAIVPTKIKQRLFFKSLACPRNHGTRLPNSTFVTCNSTCTCCTYRPPIENPTTYACRGV